MPNLSTRAVALWQIVGGALIVLVNVAGALQVGPGRLGSIYVVTSLGTAVLAIVAGSLLWQRRPLGLRLSILAQLLQLASVSLPAVQFGSTLGPTIGFRLTAEYFTFNAGFYGRGGVAFANAATGPFPLDITVNILAILGLVVIAREYRRAATVGSGLTSA